MKLQFHPGTDMAAVTSYALVNGRRTVYIPVTKRAEASTLAVVSLVKANLSRFQAALPDDIKVSYEFDQSPVVWRSINELAKEAGLGAVLTGLMVLLFLRDLRLGEAYYQSIAAKQRAAAAGHVVSRGHGPRAFDQLASGHHAQVARGFRKILPAFPRARRHRRRWGP